MGAAISEDAAAARALACAARGRARELRDAAGAQRRRADEAADRLTRCLSRGTRALGARGDSFELELARLRPLVRLARVDLRRWLDQMGLPPDVVSDVTLAVSEACANAVEHPQQATRQRIAIEGRCRGGELVIRIRDYGTWKEHPRSDQRGRGLGMINELMDSVELHRTPTGNEIVMRRAVGTN
jgi:anti-sigma regulatory factor (Ser/Thr protein kinase)